DALRIMEAGGAIRAISSSIITRHSCQRAHRAGASDFTNGMVPCIRYEEVPGAIQRDGLWIVELSVDARTIKSSRDARRPCQRGDYTRRCDLANGLIASIGYIDETRWVDRDPLRRGKSRGSGDSVFASRQSRGSGKNCRSSKWSDFADNMIQRIRHEGIGGVIHCDSGWREKLRSDLNTVVAAGRSATADRARNPVNSRARQLPHGAVTGISH